jgi:hypothetical protein
MQFKSKICWCEVRLDTDHHVRVVHDMYGVPGEYSCHCIGEIYSKAVCEILIKKLHTKRINTLNGADICIQIKHK